MKILFLVATLLISAGCVRQTLPANKLNKTIQPTPTIENSNSCTNGQYSVTDYKYDQSLLNKLNAENERFSQVPEEFRSVDFKNFKYDFGRLKEGEFEKDYSKKYAAGGEQYNLGDVFYIDLFGDIKKEAVVFISRISCGGSCDGGAEFIYFYSSPNGKPQLIDMIKAGSNAYGCSLKSFTITDKQINVEQFGRCVKDTTQNSESEYVCKFCVKDETHSIYSISKNGLKRESAVIFQTETINVMNVPAFFSISE